MVSEVSNPLAAKLRAWAGQVAVPRILHELRWPEPPEAVLLVGSVATELCVDDSDVDVVFVCAPSAYERASAGQPWAQGRPSETRLEHTQVHYFATTQGMVQSCLQSLNDNAFYVYGTARLLSGDAAVLQALTNLVGLPELRKARLEGRLDMLLRRRGALERCCRTAESLTLARMSLEVVSLALKVTALVDDVPFDPRKRLLQTSLQGPVGRRLARSFDMLIAQASAWVARSENRDFHAGVASVCARPLRTGHRSGLRGRACSIRIAGRWRTDLGLGRGHCTTHGRNDGCPKSCPVFRFRRRGSLPTFALSGLRQRLPSGRVGGTIRGHSAFGAHFLRHHAI